MRWLVALRFTKELCGRMHGPEGAGSGRLSRSVAPRERPHRMAGRVVVIHPSRETAPSGSSLESGPGGARGPTISMLYSL
jgi:hypothetical protein